MCDLIGQEKDGHGEEENVTGHVMTFAQSRACCPRVHCREVGGEGGEKGWVGRWGEG